VSALLACGALASFIVEAWLHQVRWHGPGIEHGHWWDTRPAWAHLAVPLAAIVAGAAAALGFIWWPFPAAAALWAGVAAVALAMAARPPRRAEGSRS
jgi:hypothetical protein